LEGAVRSSGAGGVPASTLAGADGGRDALEMHVAERNRELERQRKQRQIRTRSRTRPEPTHRRHASRVSERAEPFHRPV
jgi:hypothetical protein